MKLQRGTTGFQQYKEPQLPHVDLRKFRAVFHAVARNVSATIIHNPRRNPDVDCNFADALLKLGDDRIVVLLNCFHPLIAFSSEYSPGSPPEFRDHAQLATAFLGFQDYTLLSRDTLVQSVAPAMTLELAPAEMEQFRYWKPSRLGDVIFNYWD